MVPLIVRSYRAGKSVMKSSGTSSWSRTGFSTCCGQLMCSFSTAARTQSSMLKKWTWPPSFSADFGCPGEAQMGQGAYCSTRRLPSLSVAVRASTQSQEIPFFPFLNFGFLTRQHRNRSVRQRSKKLVEEDVRIWITNSNPALITKFAFQNKKKVSVVWPWPKLIQRNYCVLSWSNSRHFKDLCK